LVTTVETERQSNNMVQDSEENKKNAFVLNALVIITTVRERFYIVLRVKVSVILM